MTADECTVYGTFQRACESGKYSPLVGWIIKQGQIMLESGDKRIREIREDLQGSECHSMVSSNVGNLLLLSEEGRLHMLVIYHD